MLGYIHLVALVSLDHAGLEDVFILRDGAVAILSTRRERPE
jgi:hypothetical protein